MNLIFPYDESKLKPYLKMASKRIQIANSKRSAHSKHGKREVQFSSSYQHENNLSSYLNTIVYVISDCQAFRRGEGRKGHYKSGTHYS